MTMTRGSLSVKRVEKALLDLFTNDALQSVDRSQGKDSGGSQMMRLKKRRMRNQMDENDDAAEPYLDEERNFLETEDVRSDVDDVTVIDDERDLLKEARVARGFYPLGVTTSPDKPRGKGKGELPSKT